MMLLLLLVVVVDVVVVVILPKNYKRWVWDRSSDVQVLFENDLERLGHPLHM